MMNLLFDQPNFFLSNDDEILLAKRCPLEQLKLYRRYHKLNKKAEEICKNVRKIA